MAKKQKLIVITAIVLILIIFAVWYIFSGTKSAPTALTLPPPAASATTSASLGTQIYQQSQNPIQNKVPSAKNPAVNPIQGAYKNPF